MSTVDLATLDQFLDIYEEEYAAVDIKPIVVKLPVGNYTGIITSMEFDLFKATTLICNWEIKVLTSSTGENIGDLTSKMSFLGTDKQRDFFKQELAKAGLIEHSIKKLSDSKDANGNVIKGRLQELVGNTISFNVSSNVDDKGKESFTTWIRSLIKKSDKPTTNVKTNTPTAGGNVKEETSLTKEDEVPY